MARPIRIPVRDVGGGAAPVLPSLGAAAAPATGAARIGQAVAGAVAATGLSYADTELKRRKEADAEANALTYTRDTAQAFELVSASAAAVEKKKADFYQSPAFTEDGLREKWPEWASETYDAALSSITHPQVRAKYEGAKAGLLSADLTEELEKARNFQAGLSIDDTVSKAVQYAQAFEPQFLPMMGQEALDALDQVSRPGFEKAKEAAKIRIFSAIKNSYIGRGGSFGELRFNSDLAHGDFDRFGDVALADKAQAVGRSAVIASEILQARNARGGADWGDPIDNGGLFPTFDLRPGMKDLEALIADTDWIPGPEGDEIRNQLGAAILRDGRTQELIDKAMEPFFENGGDLSWIRYNEAGRTAHDAYFLRNVQPWLNNPQVPARDKAKFIQRELLGVGYMTPAVSTWIQGQFNTANPDNAELLMEISLATATLGANPLLAHKASTSRPELEQEAAGIRPIDMIPAFTGDQQKLRDRLVRLSHLPPALAYVRATEGLQQEEQQGAKGDTLRRQFAPSEADFKAEREATRIAEGLRDRFKLQGSNVDAITNEMIGKIRAGIDGNASRYPDSEEGRNANIDDRVAEFLKTNKHISLFGKEYFSSDIVDSLGDLPPQSLEYDILRGLEAQGIDIKDGDIRDRIFIFKTPAEGLEPAQFRVGVTQSGDKPGGMIPRIFKVDPKTSDWRALEEQANLSSLSTKMSRLRTEDFPAQRSDIASALLMEPSEFRLWLYGQTWDRAKPPPSDLPENIQTLFQATGGKPLLYLFPELAGEWDRTREAARKKFVAEGMPENRKEAREFDTFFIPFAPFRAADADEESKRQADRRVIEMWNDRFRGRSPAEMIEAIRTRRLPGDEGFGPPGLGGP